MKAETKLSPYILELVGWKPWGYDRWLGQLDK